MDDTQRIVKCGNLSLHTPGGFFKKRWHNKYLVLYDGSKSGVKRLELFESEIKFKKQSAVKIIPLVDCVRIVTCQRHKSTFTFEVRTSDQFYLLASKSFQDTNDWVNCLRLVAFGQQNVQPNTTTTTTKTTTATPPGRLAAASGAPNGPQACLAAASAAVSKRATPPTHNQPLDALLERRPALGNLASSGGSQVAPNSQVAPQQVHQVPVLTASQAAAAAASALAKTRQRQPSLLGSCKPQPPTDSPFIAAPTTCLDEAKTNQSDLLSSKAEATSVQSTSSSQVGGQVDTLTPTVRGRLIGANNKQQMGAAAAAVSSGNQFAAPLNQKPQNGSKFQVQPTLDEEEENMLYCSIEDNPSEHNYRVKVIETELALRCQLKCYQLTAPKTISLQYEELSQFRRQQPTSSSGDNLSSELRDQITPIVTFYQLIIGPQELTLLNDYATTCNTANSRTQNSKQQQQQGLWSWPYQCIRRYGFDKDNCFMFEAGRKCTSGPGQFVVQTPKAYNIYQDVVKFVNELRTIGGGGNGGVCGPLGNPITPLNALKAPTSLPKEQQQLTAPGGKQVITQIPVTWTPIASGQQQQAMLAQANSNNTPNIDEGEVAAGGPEKCRRQFFSQLSRQADLSLPSNHKTIETEPTVTQRKEGIAPMNKMDEVDGCEAIKNKEIIRSTSHDRLKPEGGGEITNINSNGNCPGHRQASRLSSGSDETDESGYEQGDESVESGPTRRQVGREAPQVKPTITATATSRLAGQPPPPPGLANKITTTSNKLTVRAPSGHSPASSLTTSASSTSPVSTTSSCSASNSSSSATTSAATSATNSPGQSVSRRTGESIQQQAANQQSSGNAANQLLIDTRLSLNKVAAQHGKQMAEVPSAVKSRALHEILAGDVLGGAGANANQQQSIDFETSLIRDVYSEITKLHAKFAVTSTGSNGEDSMSSDSRESSAAVSDRISHDNDDREDDDDDDDDDDDEDEESDCADDGCYYMNEGLVSDEDQEEPMYSNLRPTNQRTSNNKCNQPQARPVDANSPASQQQFYRVPPHHNQISRTNPNAMSNNYDPSLQPAPLSPQSMRPIYPTILNPIPEINEPLVHNHHSLRSITSGQSRNKSSSMAGGQIDNSSHTNRQRYDLSPRARLALNREAVIKLQQQPLTNHTTTTTATCTTKPNNGRQLNNRPPLKGTSGDKSKPTNHYVINDVQYAKISRNQAPSTKFR